MEGPLAAEVSDPGRVEARGDCGVLDLAGLHVTCLLYTSDAADERSSVALGGRRIIKKKNGEHGIGP